MKSPKNNLWRDKPLLRYIMSISLMSSGSIFFSYLGDPSAFSAKDFTVGLIVGSVGTLALILTDFLRRGNVR